MDSDLRLKESSRSILMFPWPAHGHISPFFELSKTLSNKNFHIYFCSTPITLLSIKPKLPFPSSSSSSIQLVELHLPSSTKLPPHLHTAKGLPSHLIPSLKEAFSMSSHNFQTILQTLKPDLLIYDSLQPWAPQIASSLNIPAIHFINTAAVMVSLGLHYLNNPDSEFPFPEAVLYHHWNTPGIILDGVSEEEANKEGESFFKCIYGSHDVILINTFRELEGKYIDYISLLSKKKVIPIGPLIHEPSDEDHYNSSIINWLDKKEPSSTVLVSFGTECFPCKEEMEEIATGLELSEANFIWVIRFPQGENKITAIEEILPEGFLERVEKDGKGMVVKDWAPQTKILKHDNTGGFLSHCGWNSVLESLIFGVPIIALPMHLDQPYNARLVESVGLGMEVKRDEEGKIKRDEIAKLVKEVMVDENGEKMRKKAREMGEFLRRKSREEKMDELVAEISPLMRKL